MNQKLTSEVRGRVTPKIKTKIPGPNAKKWVEFHLNHAANATYEKHFVWDRSAPAIGPFCTDPDGNVFLDFASHVASSPLGYNHPALTSVAAELAKIDPDRYAGTDFIGAYGKKPPVKTSRTGGKTTAKTPFLPTPAHLHDKLIEITRQFGFNKVFLTNSGAEAVENAIKLSYLYRKNFGYGFTFYGAFHGRTLGALSLNRSKNLHKSWYPQIPNIIAFPFVSQNMCQETHCGRCEENGFDRHKKAGAFCPDKDFPYCDGPAASPEQMLDPVKGLITPEEVAFIIIEPVQGEGGYNFPDPEFIKSVAQTAKKYGIPLICDEIQSGMGRTGKWWASEHFGIQPDLIAVGKALRVGATVGKEKLFPKDSYRIGSTWGEGNAISSAIGYMIIETIQKENLLDNATKMGGYLLKELNKLKKSHPLITDVRGIGLMDAMEFASKNDRDFFRDSCLQKGLLLLNCGYKAVRILPPLDVTKREIDLALEIIKAVLMEKSVKIS